MLDALRLAEKGSPVAMISWHERLYLAWAGTDTNLNLAWSPDAQQILDKLRLDQQSYTLEVNPSQVGVGRTYRESAAPALAATSEHLYLAWKSDWVAAYLTRRFSSSYYINILANPEDPLSTPVRVEEARSQITPALCSHHGSLILAWTGIDGHINLLADPETPHSAPVRLERAKSLEGPALCSHQDRLILAWSGTDRHINLARLQHLEALLQTTWATVAAHRAGRAAGP